MGMDSKTNVKTNGKPNEPQNSWDFWILNNSLKILSFGFDCILFLGGEYLMDCRPSGGLVNEMFIGIHTNLASWVSTTRMG